MTLIYISMYVRSSLLPRNGSVTAKGRWRFVSSQLVNCCVSENTKQQRDSAWRGITKFHCQSGSYEPSSSSTKELHARPVMIVLHASFQNVDEYFSVVGVLEDWSKSLRVLETFIPKFFSGATQVWSSGEFDPYTNRNNFKPKVPHFVRHLIAKNLTREIEFYNYCRQRLHKQYLSILWIKKKTIEFELLF